MKTRPNEHARRMNFRIHAGAAKSKRRTVGMSLIEMLIAGLVMVTFGTALWTLVRSSYDSQYGLMNENAANMEARQTVDTFADHLRGAASLTSAAASDITFTDSSGTSYRYWQSADKLKYSVNGSPSTGNQILKDVQSLSLTYLTWNGTVWSSPTTVTGAALSTVAAVTISANCAIGGQSRRISSTVRLRQIMRF